MRVLGIDVGMEGGVAFLEKNAIVPNTGITRMRVDAIDIPTAGEGPSRRVNAAALAKYIIEMRPDHAFIELAGSMPQQGIASAFRYGRATGSLEAVVACCDVPFTLVTPQRWKKFFGLKGPDKERSRQLAIQRIPPAAHLLARKKDHGRAEALLLALYGLTILEAQSRQAA